MTDIEHVILKLELVNSLIERVHQNYFGNREPILHELESGYKDYTNIIITIGDMTMEQQETLREIVHILYKTRAELKQLNRKSLELLTDKVCDCDV